MPTPMKVPDAATKPIRQNNVYFEDVTLKTQWLLLEEELEREHGSLFIPDKKNAVLGRVLKVGPEALSLGIREGDRCVYDEWYGGRWVFPRRDMTEQKCLVISLDHISVLVQA